MLQVDLFSSRRNRNGNSLNKVSEVIRQVFTKMDFYGGVVNNEVLFPGGESGSLLPEFANKRHVILRFEKSVVFSADAIFGELGRKEPVSL